MIFLGTSENNFDKILRLSLNDWTMLVSDYYILFIFSSCEKDSYSSQHCQAIILAFVSFVSEEECSGWQQYMGKHESKNRSHGRDQ